MENMVSPYSKAELNAPHVQRNLAFLQELEQRSKKHAVFDHPLLLSMANGRLPPEFIKYFHAQFSKHIRVFTAALATLLGSTPDIRSRFVLFDNLYEEMGRGDYEQCHFHLYLSMMESLGVSTSDLDALPPLYSVELLNDELFQAVSRKSFVTGLAWLGLGGELTIPNNFPYMVRSIQNACPSKEIDWRFFDRHGGRDQMHSDDANLVLALYLKEEEWSMLEIEVMKSLSARKNVWDELENMAMNGVDLQRQSKVA